MTKDLKMIAGYVLTVLGIKKFEKNDDGKLFLTAEQEQTLTEKFGEKFVSGFKTDLAKMEVEGQQVNLTLSAEEKLELEASRIETKRLKDQIEQLKTAEQTMKATIAKLEGEAADGKGQKVELSAIEQAAVKAGVDMSLKHNRYLVDFMQGKVSAA